MTCQACDEARLNPLTGLYNAGCTGCKARALAQSPAFYEAHKQGRRTKQYQDALRAMFGSDAEEGHKQAKKWYKATNGRTKGLL